MKRILHIIANDKFTIGYIKYMQNNMKEYGHVFLGLYNKNYSINDKITNYTILKNKREILSKSNIELMKNVDKIIVSGIFLGIEEILVLLPNKLLCKTYLQFWGGDFYCYRETRTFSRKNVKKIILKICIKRCAGIINLIPSDYNELNKIFPNNKKHFVATVRGSDQEMNEYKKYLNIDGEKYKVIVGNSATPENHHIEVFKMLESFKNENIKIVCPLSYGDSEYAQSVISKGKEIFGEKFTAVTDYMEYSDYIYFLSTFSIGIFYNDRQQAMGNINNLIKMGKKVFLRRGTSMWKDYIHNNVKVFEAQRIENMSFEEFCAFNTEYKKENHKRMIERENTYDSGWITVFED